MTINNTKYLQNVNSASDLKRLSIDQLPEYCSELREFIISEVSTNPGHLGSSLGALEIAVALHYVYDTPSDRLVWDVGHQAYAHKIITGRRADFHTNRRMGGISGFPRRAESECDCFGVGHASTSISAALGMASAAALQGESRKVVAVIGDGALSGGLAFEGLNNASSSGHDILVILNDNNISIDPNVGALKDYLLSLTTSKRYNRVKERVWRALDVVPRFRRVLQKIEHGAKSFFLHQSNLFESLDFRYFGPIDGNDVRMLVRRLQDLRQIKGPKLLHALTVKGKGYPAAEREQTEWHAPGRFDVATGQKNTPSTPENLRYQDVFGYTLVELARADGRIVGITPAMPTGSSLNIMMQQMPDRAFDVGIAEGHAVTFAAGLASEGMIPFCNIYSSFAQRSVDNIIHDVSLQRLDVVLCLDRAGLVGEDGATHHGVFDIALLRSVPHTIIAAPSSAAQLRDLMYTASLGGYGGCFVIRYPRGGSFSRQVLDEPFRLIEIGSSVMVSAGGSDSGRDDSSGVGGGVGSSSDDSSGSGSGVGGGVGSSSDGSSDSGRDGSSGVGGSNDSSRDDSSGVGGGVGSSSDGSSDSGRDDSSGVGGSSDSSRDDSSGSGSGVGGGVGSSSDGSSDSGRDGSIGSGVGGSSAGSRDSNYSSGSAGSNDSGRDDSGSAGGGGVGGRVAILSLGTTFDIASQAAATVGAAHYDLRFAKPLHGAMLLDVAARFSRIVVVEDGVVASGVGSAVLEFYASHHLSPDVRLVGVPDDFVEHGTVDELRSQIGITADHLVALCRQ